MRATSVTTGAGQSPSTRPDTSAASGPSVRVNVGGASRTFKGWVLSDYLQFDVTDVGQYVAAFGQQGVAAFRAEHMYEHLFPAQDGTKKYVCALFTSPITE